MLDALHNLALRARQCRVFQLSITMHDSGRTSVMLVCDTDDEVHALAAMLRLDGLHESLAPEMISNERHEWLHATFQCGMTELRLMGPVRAVTQDIMDLIGEIATEAPREGQAVS